MRLLIIKNTPESAYANLLFTLLKTEYARLNYETVQLSKPASNTLVLPQQAIIIYTNKKFYFFSKFIARIRLSAFIKKNKIALVIQQINHRAALKKTAQLLIINDITQFTGATKFSANTSFITYSAFAKQVMIDKGFTQTIHVIPFFAPIDFQPITWSIKQQVKMDYAEGREYFLVNKTFEKIEAFLNLLKAFSGFKKWQHSSMKLILTGRLLMPYDEWNEKFATYKYRDDVVFFKKTEQEKLILFFAAAYAYIHLPQHDGDLAGLLQAMQCHTPVITGETASIKEYAGSAVIGFEQDNTEDLAQKMILVYKDENLRSNLIKQSALQAEDFTESLAAQRLQAAIRNSVHQ